MRDLFHIEPKN